jgi:peroxiredoxin
MEQSFAHPHTKARRLGVADEAEAAIPSGVKAKHVGTDETGWQLGAPRALWRLIALAALCGGTGCAPGGGGGAGAVALPDSAHPLRGVPAPDFTLPLRGGSSARLSEYSGRVVLVDFWATWCEPCRASFPRYDELAASYGDRIAVVGVSEDDEDDGIDGFVRETGVRFPVAWDGDKSVAQLYEIESMPMLFIIDRSGLIRYVHSGFRPGDESSIRAAVDSLL